VACLVDRDPSERDFLDTSREGRRVFAELWGTFLLVLVAAGADIASIKSGGALPRPIAAAAPGIMVMVAVYFIGAVSGAHINPAVTLAFALRRNFPWRRVPGYLIAQFAGAVLACLLLRAIFGTVADLGATRPQHGVTAGEALVLEIVLTAGLVNAILATASGARNIGTNAGIAVGGYVAMAGLWASTFTGASMNPARSLGPDLVRGEFSTTWIYLMAPLIGAAIGVGFEWILKGPPTRHGSEAAQGQDNSGRG
jgi:aquaporin Z